MGISRAVPGLDFHPLRVTAPLRLTVVFLAKIPEMSIESLEKS